MSSTEFENIAFDLPKNQSNVIKVIGVGGGGSNAINHMFQQGIKGVDFVIFNTDAQALENSSIPNKIQLGVTLTEGLGAGANPEVGEQAAIESFEDIKQMLDTNTKMLFITAGMGGGTGTGAAPIIAKQAKEMDILTVGIVTIPFQFEGKMRNEQAQIGVEKLRRNVDSLIIINNNKLREVYGNLGFKAGFSKADEVLATAARGIAEVITHHYTQNIDLRDAKTVLSNSGTAIMGSATASGGSRAQDAITKALDSPLLNDNKISGAKNVLLLIVSGTEEITLDEIGEINEHIQNEAGHGANIIMGVGEDDSLEDAVSVTIIATGFNAEQQNEISNTETKKIIHTLEDEQKAVQDLSAKKTSTPTMPRPVVNETPEPPKPTKIVHVLEDDVTEPAKPKMDLVQTTNSIKNIDVIYEEVKEVLDAPNHIEDEEFIIVETTDHIKDMRVVDAEEVKNSTTTTETEEEDQFTFSFDFPINTSKETAQTQPEAEEEHEEPVVFNLTEDTNNARNIEVKESIEIIPVTETTSGGTTRYSLDDYMDLEDELEQAKPVAKKVEEVEESLRMETKTVKAPETTPNDNDEDPFNQPISKDLIDRAAERRAKMKEFNYKFRSSTNHIDEIEKQPAYKRAGVDLERKPEDSKLSRTTLNTDEDEITLRSNNSFLHDNVD
ncbi:cell division protein FtsZ [Croceibacter atlanticus]|jgi:cell division protein FtsZ|uniref:Cell division protein FtsZ n=1 Tax=Croceibacter atlanticus (strain ATCC BAA-628 / JCM 21780 / CIP 108009 / IAM 15332 / KCTC 12090 / HTCC2559) TaxID=216432 RepID=A3U822_CROAH|nr:cell division protein FtsZ [Croceibacter atlanticus]EAP88389.1 cell division protein FtsZ [Croceibacter atlanticus HTCC2559]MBW4969477.1 cell division protein FtsZ [Croceibacter atlanticus]